MSEDLAGYFPVARLGEITFDEEVASGMSGATVRSVTTTQGSYILRVFHGDQSTWDRTLAIHRLASRSGIAPPLVHVDQERRCTVSQKIATSSYAAAVAQPASSQAAFASLAAIVATLHALPTHGLATPSTVQDVREIWVSQSGRAGFPAWALALAPRLAAIEARLAQDDRQVLSHGDLNPSNILWDGARAWLIDWDGARLSHPYMDLASMANFLGLPDEPARSLLAMQEQTCIDDGQQETFKACRDLARIAYGCAFLRLISDLTLVAFASAARTAPLSQCFSRVVDGSMSMASAEGKSSIGAAFFKQCLDA
jgi:thiamine kinase-like enzyme